MKSLPTVISPLAQDVRRCMFNPFLGQGGNNRSRRRVGMIRSGHPLEGSFSIGGDAK